MGSERWEWGIDPLKDQTILVSLGDVVAVDMPEQLEAPIEDIPELLEAPIEDSGHPCFSR